MKKIKLIPVEVEDEFDDYEEEATGREWNFEFDLTPYLTTCAIACGMLFAIRFVEKHFLKP
ncbi:hypothetical protein D1646_11480 [Pseudoflavonifractor sp. 60]|uniref:hypothetical protein n=1 Tax=Pseudoflavonifractor sp. 60 TaxID=2304576 RepID=UPI001368A8B1|nr:hypothetical protein [Pseudoflavonifractor sp. 60]NBI67419.1 hypothetical protein [Pseudoflavonifractor sp. 60]